MNIIGTETGVDYKNVIDVMEEHCLKQDQVSCPVYHRFGPGIYIREVHIPSGTFAIGHYQKYEHVNIMLKGRVMMLNEDGTITELVAPFFYIGKPGRKMGYIYEDVVWQNIYATDEREIEKLEAMYLDKSEYWIKDKVIRDKANWLQHEGDREDFQKVLIESGIPLDVAREQTENKSDQINIAMDSYKVKLSDSPISGKGLFATANIDEGEIIAPARIKEKRTFAGRYTNHSMNPNSKMAMRDDGNIYLIATKKIRGCHGGFDGDEIVIDYRSALKLVIECGEVVACQQ